MIESLSDIFKRHAVYGEDAGHGDKGSTHSYIDIYERLLAPFRQKGSLMEIGLAQGWSMDMWGEYFGKEASLVGVDIGIVFDTSRFDNRFKFITSDATKPDFLGSISGLTFDVIIDDASHMIADQVATFQLLKERIKPGGLYIIEDILAPESSFPILRGLHGDVEIHDLRHLKGRWDDAIVVYRF